MTIITSLIDRPNGDHPRVISRLILICAYCIHWRLQCNMSLRCKEDSLHFERLCQLNSQDSNDSNDNDDGGESSTLMIELWIPSTPKVSGLWEEIKCLYHKLYIIYKKK